MFAICLIGCEKHESLDENPLEGTQWYALNLEKEDTRVFSFNERTFSYLENDYTYSGYYTFSSNDVDNLSLDFSGVNPTVEISKSLSAILRINEKDTLLEYEGVYYKKANKYHILRYKENGLIARYIKRRQLNILTEEPAEDYVWNEKDFYQVNGYDNFYFHLRRRSDTYEVLPQDNIAARYKQFELIENADTLSYWTTYDVANPYEFEYLDISTCESVAWHTAIKLMKYNDSECEIIVPSTLGFSDAQTSVTPYGYIMKFKVKM